MKKRTMIDGVIVSIDDGNQVTGDIVDDSECPELCVKADKERIRFLIRNLNKMGYRAMNETGNIVSEYDIR